MLIWRCINKSEKIHLEKIDKISHEIEEYKNLDYIKSKYFKVQIYNAVGLVFIIYLISTNINEITLGWDYIYFKAILYIVISLIAIFTAKWRYNKFKKNKKKNIENRINILKKLSSPNYDLQEKILQMEYDRLEKN